MSDQTCDNIFTIPPGVAFLPKLTGAILSGELVPGVRPSDDPLALTEVTIYLPTRRAVRALRREFLHQCGGEAVLLPKIEALGDEDEIDRLSGPDDPVAPRLGPAGPVSASSGVLYLARMVRRWAELLSEESRRLFGDEDIAIPSSSADAIALARQLARLIDQFETDEVDWSALTTLVPEDHSQWWQVTLAFLKIATRHWPDYLRSQGRISAAAHRRLILDNRTNAYLANGSDGPVIAAGSTGSIPATARLIKAIAGLPEGVLVLPGLDCEMADNAWAALGGGPAGGPDAAVTHPQHHLQRLLDFLGVARDRVRTLGQPEPAVATRNQAVSVALLPADFTDRWRGEMAHHAAAELCRAFAGVSIVEAPNERAEALAIALALREAVETVGQVATLVTPDRKLAARVRQELARFGIQVADSAGGPLAATAAARFVRHLLAVCLGEPDPVRWSGFINDPFLAAGREPATVRRAARLLELCLLRDTGERFSPRELADGLRRYREGISKRRYIDPRIKAGSAEELDAAQELADALGKALEPLARYRNMDRLVPVEALAAAAVEAIAGVTERADSDFTDDAAGARIVELLADLATPADARGGLEYPVRPGELPAVFDALIADQVLSPDGGSSDGAVRILGLLEARLQASDLVVLGGLNEGTWPSLGRGDSFLSRPMKGELALTTAEHRIGQAAHDFQQLIGCGRVVITRSLKVDGAATIASRWLQRLCAVAGDQLAAHMMRRGQVVLSLVEAIDRPADSLPRATRPSPTPPVEARLKTLSITEIETWIRDPYAIYARRILGLEPVPDFGLATAAARRGELLHAGLARLVETLHSGFDAVRLVSLWERYLAAASIPADIASRWRARFGDIAQAYVNWERGRSVVTRHTEIDGAIDLADIAGGPRFVLRGRADRIDVMADGALEVLDFKTGATPGKKEARTLSPQLPLTAAMVAAGGFADVTPAPIAALDYVKLRPGDEFAITAVADADCSADDLARETLDRLVRHVVAYAGQEQGYLSRYAVHKSWQMAGPYDHLARVKEWSLGDSDEEPAGGFFGADNG